MNNSYLHLLTRFYLCRIRQSLDNLAWGWNTTTLPDVYYDVFDMWASYNYFEVSWHSILETVLLYAFSVLAVGRQDFSPATIGPSCWTYGYKRWNSKFLVSFGGAQRNPWEKASQWSHSYKGFFLGGIWNSKPNHQVTTTRWVICILDFMDPGIVSPWCEIMKFQTSRVKFPRYHRQDRKVI